MKLGVCTSFDNILTANKCGFDYIEATAAEVKEASADKLRTILNLCEDTGMSVPACNCMFPYAMRVTGSDCSLDKISEHIEKTFYNSSVLGVKNFCLGSGYQRHIEPSDDYDTCLSQFMEVVNLVADKACEYGITVAVEPLNKGETNLINTVAEGAKLVSEINKPSLKLMADTYHMYIENESLDIIKKCAEDIVHVHIANPVGRLYPAPNDGVDYNAVFGVLKKIEYDGNVSVEGNTENFEKDCLISGKFLKELF